MYFNVSFFFFDLPFILPIFFVVLFIFYVYFFALFAVADTEQSAEPVVFLGAHLCLFLFVLLDDTCNLGDIFLNIATVGSGVVVENGPGVVVVKDAVVAVAEAYHADGTFLAEADPMPVAVSVEDDGVGCAVDFDREEGGFELEIDAHASQRHTEDAGTAPVLCEVQQGVEVGTVLDIDFVCFGKVVEPTVEADVFDPVALTHAEGEGVLDRAKVG